MSHRIVGTRKIGEETFWIEVEAPLIAAARRPGQFIILSINSDYSERIPLTIAGANTSKGTIELIWQRMGKTTAELAALNEGDVIDNIAGPLGTPTHIENFGIAVCVGGGIGNAPLLPIATALKQAGNRIISILGARDKTRMILEDRFAAVSDELIVCTDDGSHGRKALVTEPLKEVCARTPKPGHAFVIGPTPMMKFCCQATLPFGVPTDVSLNTIMIDGTGMCGGCRVEVDGKARFVCVDGPEFDGHKVNFDLMIKRLGAYKKLEQQAYEKYRQHQCRIGLHA
jgi:ferredoxin--NADP+ reductase